MREEYIISVTHIHSLLYRILLQGMPVTKNLPTCRYVKIGKLSDLEILLLQQRNFFIVLFPKRNKKHKIFSFMMMKGFFEKVIIVVVKNNRRERHMRPEEIEQNPAKKQTIALPELADWIKKNYPEEFLLQIEFDDKEDRNGKG